MSSGRILSDVLNAEIVKDVLYPIIFVRLSYDDAIRRGSMVPNSWEQPQLIGRYTESLGTEEFIYALSDKVLLDDDDKPDNTWTFDNPQTAGTLTWVDTTPTPTHGQPVVWVSSRTTETGPILGDWSEPIIHSHFDKTGQRYELIYAATQTDTLEASELPDDDWLFGNPQTSGDLLWDVNVPELDQQQQSTYSITGQYGTSGLVQTTITLQGATGAVNFNTHAAYAPHGPRIGMSGASSTDEWDISYDQSTHAIDIKWPSTTASKRTAEALVTNWRTLRASPFSNISPAVHTSGDMGTTPIAARGWYGADGSTSYTPQRAYAWVAQRRVTGKPAPGDAITTQWETPRQILYVGEGFERIYAAYPASVLPTSKHPDDSWGYLQGGEADGLQWYINRQQTPVDRDNPYLFTVSRAIPTDAGNIPESGDAVTDTWTTPHLFSQQDAVSTANPKAEIIYATYSEDTIPDNSLPDNEWRMGELSDAEEGPQTEGLVEWHDTPPTTTTASPYLFRALRGTSGDILVHDNIGEFVWGGETWLGVGSFGNLEHIEETVEITNLSIRLVLSGLNAEIIQEALDSNYYRRPVTIYIGVLDVATGQLKARVGNDASTPDPDILWVGYMDVMEASVNKNEFGIILTAENEDVDFERPNGKMFTNVQQQSDYPGDLAFEYLESQENLVLRFPDSPKVQLGSRHNAINRGRTSIRPPY